MKKPEPPTPTVGRMINRRAFLRGAGGVAIALPFLEGYLERSAFGALPTTPVFGFFICTANGVVQSGGGDPERFWPTALGAITAPISRPRPIAAPASWPSTRRGCCSSKASTIRTAAPAAATPAGWRSP